MNHEAAPAIHQTRLKTVSTRCHHLLQPAGLLKRVKEGPIEILTIYVSVVVQDGVNQTCLDEYRYVTHKCASKTTKEMKQEGQWKNMEELLSKCSQLSHNHLGIRDEKASISPFTGTFVV